MKNISIEFIMSLVGQVPAGYNNIIATEELIKGIITEQVEMIKAGYDVVERANKFQMAAHDSLNQVRKYGNNVPYWTHPQAVSGYVKEYGGDNEQQAAALLHDTVEDVYWVTQALINILFFEGDTAAMVDGLTDVSQPGDGNRAVRKEMDRKHTSEQPARTQFVKLADLKHNSESIVSLDRAFAKKYLIEKKAILDSMHHDAIKSELGKSVSAGLKGYYAELGM